MKVGRENPVFSTVHIQLDSQDEVEYMRVLLGIRKQTALGKTQATNVGAVASRTSMRDTFAAII